MDILVGVGVAMGTTVGSVGVAVCWPLLEEALVMMEIKRSGKIGRRPARGESEGERLCPLFCLGELWWRRSWACSG